MLHETINFTDDGRVNLKTYIHSQTVNGKRLPSRPMIIVLPGGAYAFLSDTEAEPVALTFLKEGYHTCVLSYSVGDFSVFPNPLDEVSWAISTVREHAVDWGVDPNAIVVMGFSAGAGVAGLAATQWNAPGLHERLGIAQGSNRPDAVVIGYGGTLYDGFFRDAKDVPTDLGKIARDLTPELDYAKYVGPHTPPVFMWHCRGDDLVPSIAPTIMAQAMEEADLPYELHLFQFGAHGMSVANKLTPTIDEALRNTSAAMWVPLCVRWIDQLFASPLPENEVG